MSSSCCSFCLLLILFFLLLLLICLLLLLLHFLPLFHLPIFYNFCLAYCWRSVRTATASPPWEWQMRPWFRESRIRSRPRATSLQVSRPRVCRKSRSLVGVISRRDEDERGGEVSRVYFWDRESSVYYFFFFERRRIVPHVCYTFLFEKGGSVPRVFALCYFLFFFIPLFPVFCLVAFRLAFFFYLIVFYVFFIYKIFVNFCNSHLHRLARHLPPTPMKARD